MDHVWKEKVLIALACPGNASQPMRRVGYARCSTDEQAEALAAQVARLVAAGCDPVVQELLSGRDNDRPGLLEVMAMVARGQVAELIITRADRLGRDAAFADQLIATCAVAGVLITALDGGTIEAATPTGFLQARLVTTMAEVESRMLSQRVKKQFEQYRLQGRHLRRRKPFGYRGNAEHHLEPDPVLWPQALQLLADLRRVGSFSGVAREMPSWCAWHPAGNSLQAWFVNPVIRGHLGHMFDPTSGNGWNARWAQMLYDQHEPLISESDWQDLAAHLKRTKNNFDGQPQREARHGLTGLMVCEGCNRRLRRNTSGVGEKLTAWWRCRHPGCTAKGGIRETDALQFVVEACVAAANQLAAVAAMPADDDPAVAMKRRDLEQLVGLAQRNTSLEPAVTALRQEIDSMTSRPRTSPDVATLAAMSKDPAFFSGASPEEQRALFGLVLSSVVVAQAGVARALPRSW
jgi:putative DNA-invertase from lambdoid prophage Rac